MNTNNKTILIIEDDAGIIELLAEKLEDCNYNPTSVQSAKEAFNWLKINTPYLIILDYSLPDMSGKEFITELKANKINMPPFVVSTGQGDERIAVDMMKLGARDYIVKDRNFLDLIPIVISRVSKEIESENKLQQAEQALIESNKFNNQIIRSAQEGIIVYDRNIRYQVWNPFMENLTGLPAAEVLGKSPYDVFPFLQDNELITNIKKALSGEIVISIDLPFDFPRSGKSGWVSDTIAPLLNAAGEIVGTITTVRDITERKKAEDELKLSEITYRGILDQVSELIYIQDLDGRFVDVNTAVEKKYGYPRDFFIGKTPEFLTAPDMNDFEEITKSINTAANGKPQSFEFWAITKDGKVFPKEVNVSPGMYFGKRVVIAVARDITYRKQAEILLKEKTEELKKQNEDYISINERLRKTNEELYLAREQAEASEHKVRSMFENTLTGFLFFTTNGNILEANPATIRMLGSPSMEATKQINVMTLKPLIDSGFVEEIHRCITQRSIVTNEILYTSKWGKTVYVKFFLIPIIQHNEIIGIWANLQDLTDLWQTQRNLTLAKEKAEEGDKLKTAFLNNISHEIRTPMNAIIGFSQFLVANSNDDDNRESCAKYIKSGCNQLLDIITNVIEISEIQAGQIRKAEKKMNLQIIFNDIVNQYQIEANEKNLEFRFVSYLKQDELQTITDSYKLSKVVYHIINNAIKFTHQGFINVECHLKNDEYIFSVSDSGIGVSKEMHEKIFEPFYQVEIETARNYGGTGVGLSIAKAYVENMGGRIWVQSEISKGTTMNFTIPYIPTEIRYKSENKDINEQILENMTILIAEDEYSNFVLLEEILSHTKAKILHATNGMMAVECCRKNAGINLIFMDIKMPEMNGYQAAQEIKQFQPNIYIIAQTAYALEHEREKYSGNAFDEYITKPINTADLNKKLLKFIEKQAKN